MSQEFGTGHLQCVTRVEQIGLVHLTIDFGVFHAIDWWLAIDQRSAGPVSRSLRVLVSHLSFLALFFSSFADFVPCVRLWRGRICISHRVNKLRKADLVSCHHHRQLLRIRTYRHLLHICRTLRLNDV
jgi:hypothetical protein